MTDQFQPDIPPDPEPRHMNGHKSNRSLTILAVIFLAITAIGMTYVAVWGTGQKTAKQSETTQKEQAQGVAKDLATQIDEVCKAGGEPAKKLQQYGLCQQAKAIATAIPTVIVTERPPSLQEIERAVTRYCVNSRCKGPKGDKGDKGDGPTVAQVATAIATYCNARGECKGPEGDQGDKGDTGPAPSDEQIIAGVSAFCSQESQPCKGDTGTKGDTGDTGPQGRSITEVTCEDQNGDGTFTWVITFSSGDPQGAGQCRPFPFTFTFVIPGKDIPPNPAVTYLCTINGAEGNTCETQ